MRVDDVIRIDDIATGFGHLFTVFAKDHALVIELLEWFFGVDHADVVEELVPESRIEQVKDGVFRATDV